MVYTQYRIPKVLKLADIVKSTSKDNPVLIKVFVTSVNSWDWDMLQGKPFLIRMLWGLFSPKYKILGTDVAGRIEAVGKNIKKIKPNKTS